MQSVAIFCGSSLGNDPIFLQTAQHVGEILAKSQLKLVYGGAKVGLMGAVADAVLANGGQAIGVIPKHLVERELVHPHLTELHIVDNMHQRKAMMSELADAFVALPGGTGTLEEIFEQWTWAQLGLHKKPCAFLNVNDYYQPIEEMLEDMLHFGFMKLRFGDMLIIERDFEKILQKFHDYHAPKAKWSESQSVG